MNAYIAGIERSRPSLVDAKTINQLVQNAPSPYSCIKKFSHALEITGVTNLFFASYDVEKRLPSKTHISELPDEVLALRDVCSTKLGCTLIEHVHLTKKTYWAAETAETLLLNRDTKRYVCALKKLQFVDFGVLTVRSNGLLHVMFVGIDTQNPLAKFRETLEIVFQNFMAKALRRFPDLGFFADIVRTERPTIGPEVMPSEKEIECIFWTANGKTSFEIAQILMLSEHTVNHYIASTCKKLGATNRAHAIVKAMKLGLFDLASLH